MARMTRKALLGDERITAVGLLFEAEAALAELLDDDLKAEAGISLVTYEVLIRLGRSPGQRLRHTELGRQLSLTTGGITRIVDRLDAAGLVERVADPADRRGSFARLTDEGMQILLKATRVHLVSVQKHLVEPLGVDGLDSMTTQLRRLRDGLVGDPKDRVGAPV